MKFQTQMQYFVYYRHYDIVLMILTTINKLVPSNGISAASVLNGLTRYLGTRKVQIKGYISNRCYDTRSTFEIV